MRPQSGLGIRWISDRVALYGGAALAIVTVSLIAFLTLLQMRQLTDGQTVMATQNMSRLMVQTYDGLIDSVDIVLLASADEIHRQIATHTVEPASVDAFLSRQQQRVPRVSYLFATNARGDLIYGVGNNGPAANIADRDYFLQLRKDPAAPLFVSGPLWGRVDDRWTWVFARRISAADGSFAGVVTASIFVDELDKLLAQNTLGVGDAATLRDHDMRVLARHVYGQNKQVPPGDANISSGFVESLQANPNEGTYISGSNSVDGISRIQSYRQSQKYHYYVNAGISVSKELAVWRLQVAIVSSLVAAFALITIVAARVIAIGWERQQDDIASLRAAQQGIRHEQELMHALMDNVPDQIFFKDKESRFLRINSALARRYGIASPEDAIGKTDSDFYGPEHAHKTAEDERRIMATGKPILGIVDNELWPDGSRTWNVCSKMPLYDSAGVLIGTYGIAHDITEQLETQARLKEANDTLEHRVEERTRQLEMANHALSERQSFIRAVADAVPSMIGYWSNALRCQFANRAFEEWFHVKVETILGMHARDVLGADLFASNEPSMRAALRGQVQLFERQAVKVNGEIGYMSTKYIPHVKDGVVQGFYVLVEDITEVKRAQNNLLALNRELAVQVRAASEANLAKSEFLANMSHEIRTPLSAIFGMAKLVRREPLSPKQSDQMDKLEIAVTHLNATINDILDLSKIEANKLVLEEAPLHIASLFQNIASMVEGSMQEKGLHLLVAVDPMPDGLIGDATRLGQALLNYVGNAVKFTESGSVAIRARVIEDTSTDALVRFDVQDTGSGISSETQAKLFAPFVQADNTTSRRYGGSGLGLAITKRLVEAMGGEVGIDSAVGVGSTFWLTARLRKDIAFVANAVEPDAALAIAALQRDFSGCRVLLAEDDEFNRAIGRILLEEVGLLVDEAEDGHAALEMALRGGYDLILMDMQMPRIDGLEATRRIRGTPEGATLPIVAMTANAFAEDKVRCLAAGMNDFVTKPVDPAMLYRTILAQLQRHAAEQRTLGAEH